MKKIRKISIAILVLVVTGLLAVFVFFEYGGYFLFTKEEREVVKDEIIKGPPLPDNFINVYTAVYPEALKRGLWNYIGTEAITGNYNECPCRDAAYPFISILKAGNFYKAALVAFQIENIATQRQCLEFVLNNMYFSNGVKGINNAAKRFYEKELAELNDDQALELIVMAKNPSLYNKERRPELIKQQVEN